MEHYYGDSIRKLFIFAALIIVVGLPFVYGYLGLPITLSLVAALALVIFAALTSPNHKWVIEINAIVSAVALLIFEAYAIRFYNLQQPFLFVTNEILALLFLVALYYSVKTWRGRFNR
ncbi:MAG: hypothetical protein ABI643_03220 [Candidatus Doudnabacteria bacterium]